MLFGSHNPESCAKVLDVLVNVGLATHEEDGTVKLDDLASERVCCAQLYGACACACGKSNADTACGGDKG